MKMTQRLAVIGAILLAALLAFPLRTAVYEVLVVPISYLIWNLYLLYRATPQLVLWVLVFVLMVLTIGNSLLPEVYQPRKKLVKLKSPQGPVESLATWMKKSQSGVYFKWLIANRLGKLAHQMLAQRETHHVRSVFAPLTSPDWTPPKPVQDYLEVGLHGSFADFPQASVPWAKSIPTPLDCDLAETVKALESQNII
ncbi:MAG: hypothetical protein MUO77_09360 [Anaerolineales bacterium]|nr:hypothetical protein [Anaerolineales bacterium]